MREIDPAGFGLYEPAFQPNVRMSDYAYSLCGGPCIGMFVIESPEMLTDLVRTCLAKGIPYRVFGGLSNVLISDEGFSGVILLNRKGLITHKTEEDGRITLTAGAGVAMARVVNYSVENGLSGFEWACGLPGTVGGAVYGNAGAFGSEIADNFISCTVVDTDGVLRTIDSAGMAFAYRSSAVKRHEQDSVILSASFSMTEGDPEQIHAAGEVNREKRKAAQPVSERSLGSVFKNPEGLSAGKLIQDAGLKGLSIGKATVSMKHANFITTAAGVRSEDYRALVRHVQKAVFEQFGVKLETEIEFLGFED